MNISLCPSPELYYLYHRDNAVTIIVDIFRASTTIVTAFYNGVRGILPVSTTEEARQIGRERGYLIAAERNVRRCDFADLGNDPSEYTTERIGDQRVVMTTTNGTRALNVALEAGSKIVLIGSFLNLEATLDYCYKNQYSEIIVLGAGWQGQISLEDSLFAGALASRVEQKGMGKAEGDACLMVKDLWEQHCGNLEDRIHYLSRSEHYQRLCRAGMESAVPYCLELNSCPIVVGLNMETLELGYWD